MTIQLKTSCPSTSSTRLHPDGLNLSGLHHLPHGDGMMESALNSACGISTVLMLGDGSGLLSKPMKGL